MNIYVVTELFESDCYTGIKVLNSFTNYEDAVKYRDYKIVCKCRELDIDPETHDYIYVVSPITDNYYTYDIHTVKLNDSIQDSEMQGGC